MSASRPHHRVLVIESEPLTRFGICTVISLHPLLYVCGEAANARAARQACVESRPDLILLDIVLPNGDGVELIREFAQLQPKARLVVVTQCTDHLSVQRAFRAGARAYISKREEATELLAALERVITGGIFVSSCVAHSLADHAAHSEIKEMHTLSNRELHIFRRLGRKQGPTSIATELGVSLKTIETYQRRIIEKLHFSDGRHLRSAAENWVLGTSVYPKALCSSAIARYRRTTKRRKP